MNLSDLLTEAKHHCFNCIYLVEEGFCHIRHPKLDKFFTTDPGRYQYLGGTLTRGEYFGECLALQQQSVDYFGDIYAGKDLNDTTSQVKMLKITPKTLNRIPYYER